jgi:hypothetical protein
MMSMKKTQMFNFLLVSLATVLLCWPIAVAAGETPKIIALEGESGVIAPDSITAKLGTTMIWHNKGPGPITIKFTTRIGLACAAPMNFYSDLMGYYETSSVPQGGTASICLIEEGTYEYEVRRLVAKDKSQPLEIISKGKVIAVK